MTKNGGYISKQPDLLKHYILIKNEFKEKITLYPIAKLSNRKLKNGLLEFIVYLLMYRINLFISLIFDYFNKKNITKL